MTRLSARSAVLAAAVAAVPLCAGNAAAQDRLIGTGAFGAGATLESVRFGGNGYRQADAVGGDTIRLRSIQQYAVPITLAVPLGTAWTVDVQTAWSSSRLRYVNAANVETDASLSGPTDVRLRATGRLFDDAVVLTAGINAPVGKTELGVPELRVLRAAAAPGLGLGAPPVGAGPSGTMGMVVAREIGGWAVALGGSYEMRGTYQPIAALSAGAPIDFSPGNVVRGSLGLDRLVGGNRVSITTAVDVYSDDLLEDPNANRTLATIRLGPVVSTDLQWQVAAPRVKELAFWVANRYRTPYSRDGKDVSGTSAMYFDGGVRTSVPLSTATDVLITGDGRWHSGLEINQGIATAGVASGGGTLGLVHRRGSLSFQPYLRAQAGSLRPRLANGSTPGTSFFGGSAGLIIVTRF